MSPQTWPQHSPGTAPGASAPSAGWTFRRVTRDDFALLGTWLAQPQVHRWWQHDPSPQAVARDFGPSADGAEPNQDWLALYDGAPVGLVQRSRVTDYAESLEELSRLGQVPAAALTIDYLVGGPRGVGLGSSMLAAFAARCWADDPDATAILVMVVAANRRSWRALQRAGFAIVGQGEATPENPEDDPLHYLLRLDRPARRNGPTRPDRPTRPSRPTRPDADLRRPSALGR